MISGLVAVIGVTIASNMESYKFFVPIALVASAMLSFVIMFISMNKLVSITIDVNLFFKIFLYSLPLVSASYFYENVHNTLDVIGILGLYGTYFLFIIYTLVKKRSLYV